LLLIGHVNTRWMPRGQIFPAVNNGLNKSLRCLRYSSVFASRNSGTAIVESITRFLQRAQGVFLSSRLRGEMAQVWGVGRRLRLSRSGYGGFFRRRW